MTSIWDWRDVLAPDIKKLSKMTKVAQKEYAFLQTLKTAKKPRFKSRCHVCHAIANEHTRSYGWAFHHLEYLNNELTHRHFKPLLGKKPNPEFLFEGKEYSKIDFPSLYKLEVIRQVRKNPKIFRFVDSAHHQAVEKLDRFKPENVKRLIGLWKETRTRWKNK